jgi:hypothetical protein
MAPFPCFVSCLTVFARWRLLERKRSPAIREVTPIESPLSRLQHPSSRSESLPAPDLSSPWPMFDPSQYWHTQPSLEFLPGLTPSPVEQLQVQPPSHSPRAAVSIPPSERNDFRATPPMISAYRYPASFDQVFTALEPPQGIDYTETSEMHPQANIPELRTNVTDLDTPSDSSSVSALQHEVEMDTAVITQLDVSTREEGCHNINESPLDDLENTVSDYDNCRLRSPTPEDVPSEPISPTIASPVGSPSQQTQPAETNAVDRRLPRLSSTLATSSE